MYAVLALKHTVFRTPSVPERAPLHAMSLNLIEATCNAEG